MKYILGIAAGAALALLILYAVVGDMIYRALGY